MRLPRLGAGSKAVEKIRTFRSLGTIAFDCSNLRGGRTTGLNVVSALPGGAIEWRGPVLATSVVIAPRNALENQLVHFCAVVRGEEVPRVDGADGIATVAPTLAVIESGQHGEVVQVETL
jgi:hypothetical protein